MQAPQLRLMSSYGFPEDFSDAFSSKLRIREYSGNGIPEETAPSSSRDPDEEIEGGEIEEEVEDEEIEDGDDEECEFSFAPNGQASSPISAEDIFSDGLIRPVFPLFNRDLLVAGDGEHESEASSSSSSLRPPLRKLFSESPEYPGAKTGGSDEGIVGPYCDWSSGKPVVETSPEACRKSNSTGFSKLWRFRDLVSRSSSDGKDAFVFLSPPIAPNKKIEKREQIPKKPEASSEKRNPRAEEKKPRAGVRGKVKAQTSAAAYARNREAKERQRRRSYLPYRQDLLGFFTNVNGLSRNVHPF